MTSTVAPAAATARGRVAAAFRLIREVDRPEVWISLREQADVVAEAAAVDRRRAAGEHLPLAGLLVAVKDNVDVAGLPTTAACPGFGAVPEVTATAVQRLVEAGAIVLGKTNMDQFATGLVGSRSPHGAVRAAADPSRISGGSSSGSAVAVALGIADIGIGTDTAGSGRVPAAFNGLVGLKASLGVVPTTGVLPACVDYDCVSVFGRDLATAGTALAVMAGPDTADPHSRAFPADAPCGAPPNPVVAVPAARNLHALTPEYRDAFDGAVRRLAERGVTIRSVDVEPLLAAARLLYDGAIVAERYAAVGAFLATAPAGADPTVSAIILAAEPIRGHELVRDTQELLRAKATAGRLLAGYDALLLPTTTEHPSLDEVATDPVGINRRLGTFTNFCNLLDMAAMAVPGPVTGGGAPFGVMFVVPAFADQVALDLAARFTGTLGGPALFAGTPVAVFGAHLRDQPLNHELVARGACFVAEISTSDAYRLYELRTAPPKPGLVRVGAGRGAAISGELWSMAPAGLGTLLAALPPPMSLTPVELADGRWVVGFGCAQDALEGAPDITRFGGWLARPPR